ncbi:thioredoxin domain-containing protein [Pseudolysinimonas yzui]|uniref:Spermatogenesis-associated protein 20-like TRX domain-containing protein n=1 Tax=Pseudolysinimonas yzui TaxID=2708254 RepID=A0A8J3M2G3_9MICO|nr:DUF255 domain-containing protein [Pseudolysinimonas yzui]GHF23317.1 hypothetical protein GCM10011600_25510 [Pseudolysinimonas yzui]
MTGSRLADSTSPYLRSHAGNPVDWWPWSEQAFAEAARRDVPVLISIGYATCHWCHVMARESFSDPEVAAQLAAGFVAIKVDREEHPDVDAAYLAAASAFTPSLGWPLTVFTTPAGAAFYAGTYFPPRPVPGVPAFREVLDAITDAWTQRRDDVEQTASTLVAALTADRPVAEKSGLSAEALEAAVADLAAAEDREFGGFGTAPKFPTTPVLAFLLEQGGEPARALAERTLSRMAASPLRDAVEGGFFRYAVQRDWSEPHYERMLTDNAQLLACYAAIGDAATASGIAGFLLDRLRVSGGFASGQDSESELDGVRNEGGYYALDAAARATQPPPPLDGKVLTGLNGLAIGALADAGVRFARDDWIAAAREAADAVLAVHGSAAPLRRASLDGRPSDAVATLEDYGGLAGGLARLALATGEPRYAVIARDLVEACDQGDDVAAPSGPDPVLAARGLSLPPEIADGATPSGRALLADAALLLAALGGDDRHRRIAERAIAPALTHASGQPLSFGGALGVAVRLGRAVAQLVVVGPGDSPLAALARGWGGPDRILALVTDEQAAAFAADGFELFAARVSREGRDTAYLCEHFVCDLPLTDAAALADRLGV